MTANSTFITTTRRLANKTRPELLRIIENNEVILVEDVEERLPCSAFRLVEQFFQAWGASSVSGFTPTNQSDLIVSLLSDAIALKLGHLDSEFTEFTILTDLLFPETYKISLNLTPEALLEFARDVHRGDIKDGFAIEFFYDSDPTN